MGAGNLINNNYAKCENNLSDIYENETIISCIKEILPFLVE